MKQRSDATVPPLRMPCTDKCAENCVNAKTDANSFYCQTISRRLNRIWM